MKFLCYIFLASLATAGELPVTKGLALWLDASKAESFELSEDKQQVKSWSDRRGNGLKAEAKGQPRYVAKGMNGRGVASFDGKGAFLVPGALKGAKETTVFVVFRRSEDQANGKKWQKIVTDLSGKDGLMLHTGQKAGAVKTKVFQGGFHQVGGVDLGIGTGAPHGGGELWGDIAEVLVYHRTFYVAEPMDEIVKYLEKKWGFKEDRDNDWTRVGPLPKIPERLSDKLPLSDQKNEGQWTSFTEMWDEFDSGGFDNGKWWDHNPTWYGRPPARYLAREVNVKDGEMLLTMTKDPSLKVEKFYGDDYRDYSSGSVKSKKATLYGYFEIKAKAMASAASGVECVVVYG